MRFRQTIIFLVILNLFLCGGSAFAYLDPGVGSFFFQFTVAFVVGLLYAVKMFWRGITARVSGALARISPRKAK